jgi:hypothetical protein
MSIYVMFLFVFISSCLLEGSCLIYVMCVCLRIVMSNTYYVVCFSSSCWQFLWIIHFCLIAPSVFSNVYVCCVEVKAECDPVFLTCLTSHHLCFLYYFYTNIAWKLFNASKCLVEIKVISHFMENGYMWFTVLRNIQ